MDRMLKATAVAEDSHYWFKSLRRSADRLLREATSGARLGRIVDCGCGTGRNLDWLRGHGDAMGVELTPFAIEVARHHGRRVVRGTVTALPLADASVELATSFDVLYCLDDASEARALGEMWRVLAPGGLVLVNVAALDVLRGSHSTLTHEVRRYTRRRLVDRLHLAGFDVVRMTFLNMSLFPPAFAVRSLERLTGRAAEPSEADLAVPHRAVNTVLDWVLRGETLWLPYGNLPIGTSLMAVARKRQ